MSRSRSMSTIRLHADTDELREHLATSRRDGGAGSLRPRSGFLCDVRVPAYTRDMSMNVAEVERALLSLDRRDRAEVLHRGIQSLDLDDHPIEDQAEVDAAWRAELRRRIDDIESGKVELLDVDESHAQLRAELAARRQ